MFMIEPTPEDRAILANLSSVAHSALRWSCIAHYNTAHDDDMTRAFALGDVVPLVAGRERRACVGR